MRFNCQAQHDFVTDDSMFLEYPDDETTIIHGRGDDGSNVCYKFTADGSTRSLSLAIGMMTIAAACVADDREYAKGQHPSVPWPSQRSQEN